MEKIVEDVWIKSEDGSASIAPAEKWDSNKIKGNELHQNGVVDEFSGQPIEDINIDIGPVKIEHFVITAMELDGERPLRRQQTQPATTMTERQEQKTGCSNCSNIVDRLEKKIEEVKKTMQQENKILRAQLQTAVDSLTVQKEMLDQLLRQQVNTVPLYGKFPVLTDNDLEEMEAAIGPETSYTYVNTMKAILAAHGVRKGLRYILSDEIVCKYNIQGVHNKKALKDLPNFFEALLASIPEGPDCAENQLREAIQLQKKRFFKKICISKKNSLEKNLLNKIVRK